MGAGATLGIAETDAAALDVGLGVGVGMGAGSGAGVSAGGGSDAAGRNGCASSRLHAGTSESATHAKRTPPRQAKGRIRKGASAFFIGSFFRYHAHGPENHSLVPRLCAAIASLAGCYRSCVRDELPDVRDGLTRKERIVLTVLAATQAERGDRNVPLPMLYGRVLEHVDMSVAELQAIVVRLLARESSGR